MRKIARIVTIAGAISIGMLGFIPAAQAATGSVTPNSNLTDGQSVKVTAAGMPARTVMAVLLCSRGATSSAQCEGSTADVSIATDANGSYTNANYSVFVLPDAIIQFPSITCNQSSKCDVFIGVDYNDFSQPHVFVPIEYRGPDPDTTITSGPASYVKVATASLAFSGTDDVTPASSLTFECKLDTGTFATCISPKTYAALTPGSHTFSVRAKDGGGRLDPSPATKTWIVDASAPASSFGSNGPALVSLLTTLKGAATDNLSGVNQVIVTWTPTLLPAGAQSGPATLSCNGARTSCTWTSTVPLIPGMYTVTAKATDRAGNSETTGPAAISVIVI